jgi:hypothetical protein
LTPRLLFRVKPHGPLTRGLHPDALALPITPLSAVAVSNLMELASTPAVGSSAPALSPNPTPPPAPPLPPGSLPLQLIIYYPSGAVILEGTYSPRPDGTLDLQVPILRPPSPGTPVQVVLYDPSGNPTIHEGTSGPVAPDGSFPING